MTTETNTTEQPRITVKKLKKVRCKAGKKSIRISWKKDKSIAGIEIQYALTGKKKMKWKNVSVSKSKSTVTLKKLKKNKKYKIRIRSYKKCMAGNKSYKVYSDWVQKIIKTK